jgi:hypothetical protein
VGAGNRATDRACNKSGGAHGASAWIWRGVKRHFGRPVAVGGERSPRRANSGGTIAVHNATSKTKHDIEFNGTTRLSGRYFTTHCGHANPGGIGRVVRDNGSWVTFSKVGVVGIVQCGIAKGTDAIAKAALKHCG